MDRREVLQAVPLWSGYVQAKRTLLNAGLVRSFKSTESDFAEWLVMVIYDGVLPSSKSHPNYDVVAGDKRIQVKSITKMSGNPNGYKIDDKKDRQNNPVTGATHYAFVIFDELIPDSIFLVPEAFVREFGGKQIKRNDLEQTRYRVEVDLSAFKNGGG